MEQLLLFSDERPNTCPFPEENPAAEWESAYKKEQGYDQVAGIMAWEAGDMDGDEEAIFFAHLVRTGLCWQLQGCYGRRAMALIEAGIVSRQGTVLA